MKKINPSIVLEVVWLITFVACLAASIHQTINQGVRASIILYIITILALSMFSMRRYLRKTNQNIHNKAE